MSYEPPPTPPQPPQPPGGGYGAPPPSGPPQGGGYGAPPPGAPGGYGGPPGAPGGYGGPPGGGYGAPPTGPGAWDVGTAVSYGWSKFQANMGQMILAALAIFAGLVVIYLIGFFLVLGPALTGTDAGGFVSLILFALLYVVMFIYVQVVGAGLIRESLKVTAGQPFTTAGVFKFENIGNVVVTSLLIGLGTFIGTLLCVIPGIIFGFLTMFSLYFVVERNLQPVDAIKASIDLVKNNLGPTIIWYLVAYVIILVGALACGLGLLVAIPVVLLGSAYTYKTLTGQPVAP